MEKAIMNESFYPFDFAAVLDSAETIEVFLADAFETEDLEHIRVALGIVARSEGVTELVQKTDISREKISDAFSAPDALTSEISVAVLKAMNLRLPLGSQQSKVS
jgi:probable addiction module antidote protein